ncbi:hypothetical protein AT15_08160 [Kosmotoga arenicorallina S304]|uniref:Uncharacterized protein n=1 Tax=Kosmotoga arenicorallina S304 TaxID=1453497 RepID=A0A182C7X6_9BACT|nr:hypothetical protein [Kosmotoga arenicorallina]OAA31457.1 hypothetical protein AT15_08160 [Kosmotoga arenicorallina S304]
MTGRNVRLLLSLAFIIIAIWLMKAVNQWFVFLVAGVFLFPLLRDFGILKDLDERERYLDAISSRIALIATVLVVLFQIGLKNQLSGDDFFVIVLIPIVTKALVFIGMCLPKEKAINYYIRVLVIIYLGFVLLSHGISAVTLIESLPGIAVLIFGELSKRWKWFSLGLFGMAGLITSQFIDNITRPIPLLVYYLITSPIVLAGIRTLMHDRVSQE